MSISAHTMTKRLTPGLILGFVVFIGLALLGDLQQVSQLLLNFHWEFFLFAIGLTLINYALRFVKWHFFLGQVGVRGVSYSHSLRMFVAGFPLAVTPGKVGEGLKGVWLNRASNIPVGRGVSVVLAERISDGLAVMILATLGIFTYREYWPVFSAILGMLLLIILVSQIRPVALFLIGLGEKLPLVNRIAHQVREFYEGSFSLFRPGALLLAVLLGTLSWLGEGVGLYYILVGLGVPANTQLLIISIFVLSFSTAVGAASAMPGGLGAAEGSIAVMLTALLHIEPAIATSATLLIRLATLWFGVAIGLLVWPFFTDLLGLEGERKRASEV
jgi:glycosyltransferase 2 family protein